MKPIHKPQGAGSNNTGTQPTPIQSSSNKVNPRFKQHNFTSINSSKCSGCGATLEEIEDGLKPAWCKVYTEQEVMAGEVFTKLTRTK